MRDTTWGGRVQKMVFPDGTPKGMKRILIERGVNVTKMKGDKMRSTCTILNMKKHVLKVANG